LFKRKQKFKLRQDLEDKVREDAERIDKAILNRTPEFRAKYCDKCQMQMCKICGHLKEYINKGCYLDFGSGHNGQETEE
jgi:hypothetical protein